MATAVESRRTDIDARPGAGRIHVIGAGPVGLLAAALLQSVEGISVRLYEKRPAYTRSRMVQLAPYLVADSIESYSADPIDGHSVEAIFDTAELNEALAFRQSIAPDLMALLRTWSGGFCPLNVIEEALSRLFDARGSDTVQRIPAAVTPEDALAMCEPGDVLVDCTGCKSLLRDHLAADLGAESPGANTLSFRLEYAAVITFVYGQSYECNEYCKYYKNADNARYKFIPAVQRTSYDGTMSHVTGIVNITAEDYASMPARCDGEWLRTHFPAIGRSMDRFIDAIREETNGEIVGDLEVLRIPLELYRARSVTSRRCNGIEPRHPWGGVPVFLVGDAAMGSPYFQSISLGFECAMYLTQLLARRDLPISDVLDRYELYMHKQWMRVYMRTKMIKHNKDLFEAIDDPFALLDLLHIY